MDLFEIIELVDIGTFASILAMLLLTISTMLITRINANSYKKQEKFSNEVIDLWTCYINQSLSSSKVKEKDADTTKKFDDKIEELIENHHEQAIKQSVVQFWFSLIASAIGFVFIIVIIVISDNLQWYEYILKTLPGIIIEAVSVLFFSQSKETRERASDFLNRLREDRQFAKSIAIVDTIDDENLKSLVKAEISLHLCGIKDIDVITKEIANRK